MRGKRSWQRFVFGRGLVAMMLLVLQLAFMSVAFHYFEDFLGLIWDGALLLNLIVLVYLINSRSNPMFKLAWVIPIILLPIFGTFLYLVTRIQTSHNRMGRRHARLVADTAPLLSQDPDTLRQLAAEDPLAASTVRFMVRHTGFPVYAAREVCYYPQGEDLFSALVAELEQARHFIFMEFFIIQPGIMWDTLLEILARKASEGVEVRVMYDGMFALYTLSYDYPRVLADLGIQCQIFSPLRPALSTTQNNRDHRKIVVIDGVTGLTGGINLADEYINRRVRFGHWKDTGILIRGEAVQSLTLMFLQMWDVPAKTISDYQHYLTPAVTRLTPVPTNPAALAAPAEPAGQPHGYVLPFGDSPLDLENTGEQVYLDLLHQSTTYVHIMTPYLVLDHEMMIALTHTAKRDVEVMLILPHIPDKQYAFWVARTHYPELFDAGVRIFEYTPGFMHAKCMVADDRKAVVGTINLDFRSLYLHFECAAALFGGPAILAAEDDFQKTLSLSKEMSIADYQALPALQRAAGRLLRLFAPMM